MIFPEFSYVDEGNSLTAFSEKYSTSLSSLRKWTAKMHYKNAQNHFDE